MPKKNKKPSKNGYWQFAMECRDKNPGKHASMSELQTYASQKWANMSKDERAPYENRANLARHDYRPGKFTSDGLDIEDVERQRKELLGREQDMKTDISRTIQTAFLTSVLNTQIFLIIHINHLVHHPNEDRFYICEIAIAAMSLKNGVEDVYHEIVKPGRLPLGFYGTAANHSKETHQLLELVQDEPYEDNTQQVFDDVIQFMRKYSSNKNQLPILYSEEKTLEMVTKVFHQFQEDFLFEEKIKVYNLQYLLYVLKNTVSGKAFWPNESHVYSVFEKDLYCYSDNISCKYHEVADLSIHCSMSIVNRHCYTICDQCCEDLKIRLIAGRHVPGNAKVPLETKKGTTTSGSIHDEWRTVNSSKRYTTSYDSDFPGLSSTKTPPSVVSFSSMKSEKNVASTSSVTPKHNTDFRKFPSQKSSKGDLKFPDKSFY